MIKLSEEFGARVHIVHHSSADSLALLREAKAAGVKITAETCPHYLSFAAEEIPDGATEFKCCPPIRERDNREQLWNALGEGTIDLVVSDHSPCPPAMSAREWRFSASLGWHIFSATALADCLDGEQTTRIFSRRPGALVV